MRCRDFRELVDSYLSDELLIETNLDLIRHLEMCGECQPELAARRELRSRLRDAFEQAGELQVREEFAVNLKQKLQDISLRPPQSSLIRNTAFVAIAASLVIVSGFGFWAWQLRSVTENRPSVATGKPTAPSSVAAVSALLTERAIGDHRDCAVDHRLKERPIDLDEAGRRYDRAYINLARAVMSDGRLPGGTTLVAGHSCIFNGQRFGHIILKYHDQIVSVLVTATDGVLRSDQRTFDASEEEMISSTGSGEYRLAHFETERHLVFVVSALSELENGEIARAIAPSVSKHIAKAEREA